MIQLHCEDCVSFMEKQPPEILDLTITSPPYDSMRTYQGPSDWCREKWEAVLSELFRLTKDGGSVVWVVGDQTKNGSETGTSFLQAIHAKTCGFRLHDTMIYQKNQCLPKNHNRYEQAFEYMFIFSKGRPKTFNPIRVPTKYPEKETARKNSYFSKTSETGRAMRSGKKRSPVKLDKIKGNIWSYSTGRGHSTLDIEAFQHPAIFPESLVRDHVLSWSNKNDLVFDPFMGSGTTGKVSIEEERSFLGVELIENYFSIAQKRIAKAERKLSSMLFR